MAKAVPKRSRRRGTKEESLERLLAATLDVLHEGGESAVTTVSVTRKAGLTQSMFYQHFANLEACLAAASERITHEIRQTVAVHRSEMYEKTSPTIEDLEQAFREMFELASKQRPILQLFLRHRTDPLALGGVMYRLGRGLSEDLAAQLLSKYGEAGLDALPADWVDALAADLVCMSLSAIERFYENSALSVADTATRLATSSSALVAAFLRVGAAPTHR